MRFTFEDYRRPNYPRVVRAEDTLQIVSIQVKEINGGLEWPLDVYGIVAVRDVVDRRRNMLFDRKRDDYQRISEEVRCSQTRFCLGSQTCFCQCVNEN
jgi:hypothetical protein